MATKYATLKDSNGDTIYPQISTDSITDGSITSSKIDWSTLTPAYYYELWPYVSTTGSEHNSAALAGTYTSDTTIFSTTFTPTTSGKFLIVMSVPAHGGVSGTGFLTLNVGTTSRWCAVPKFGDNSFCPNVVTMVYNGTAGMTYTVSVKTLRSNTDAIGIPNYMGASISITEL